MPPDEDEVHERDLPPQAAERLHKARLRAVRAELAGLQEASQAREAKLSSLEKEVQQLR